MPELSSWMSVERRPAETLRLALERTLREAITSGALRHGVHLPASRQLASELGVSRGVVVDAYDQLTAQGFLITRPRMAPVVAAVVPSAVEPPARDEPATTVRYDFRPWCADVNLFPLERWLSTCQRVMRDAERSALDYREHRGERSLREALANHLGRTRGVIADAQRILITEGTSHGIDIVARMLKTRRGSRFAVENPSFTGLHPRITGAGLQLVPQPVDAQGLVVQGLRADAVLVTPAHQYPTGAILSGERRRELIAWARASGAIIVEDDYDSEFRYDHAPVRALQGLAPDCVVHLGTTSKTMAPALRLGWLVAPPALIESMERQKQELDNFSSPFSQLTLAAFIRSGDHDRHIRRARKVYRERRGTLLAALRAHLPELPIQGVDSGLSVLACLPDSVDDLTVAQLALEASILVSALSSFYVRSAPARGLVIGYGRIHESAIDAGIAGLAGVIRSYMRVSPARCGWEPIVGIRERYGSSGAPIHAARWGSRGGRASTRSG